MQVLKLRAICSHCHREAAFTHRLGNEKDIEVFPALYSLAVCTWHDVSVYIICLGWPPYRCQMAPDNLHFAWSEAVILIALDTLSLQWLCRWLEAQRHTPQHAGRASAA